MSKQIVTTDPEKLKQGHEILNDALAAAQEGDPAELERIYDQIPDIAQAVADRTLRAERGILAWWPDIGSAPKLYLDKMRENLGYDVSGGLECLLIDQIVVCWLRLQQAELIRTDKDREGVGISASRYFDRRLEVANKTFLRACKTLAQVQRLLKRDTTQINILAQQQVNIGSEDSRSKTD